MASQKTTYEEVGLVVDEDEQTPERFSLKNKLVYFDSWLAKKFPVKGTDKFVWFVKYEDVVAYEPVSKE